MESSSADSRKMTKDIANNRSNCCELEAQLSLHWRLLSLATVKIKTMRSTKPTPVSLSLQALCRHWLSTIESHWSFQDLHIEAWYKRTRCWNPNTCPDGRSTMTPKSPICTWSPPGEELAWEQVCQTKSLIRPSRNSSLAGVLDLSNKVTKNRSTSLVEAQFTLSKSGLQAFHPRHSQTIAPLWIEYVLFMKSKHPLQLLELFSINRNKSATTAKQHQQQVCLTLFAVPHPSLFAVQVLSRKPILIVT